MLFTEEYQLHLLTRLCDPLFMRDHHSLLTGEMFDPPWEDAVTDVLKRYERTRKTLTPGQVRQLLALKGIKGSPPFGVNSEYAFDREQLVRFGSSALLRKALAKAHVLDEQGESEKAVEEILKARSRFPRKEKKTYGELFDVFEPKRHDDARVGVVSTGLTKLDKILVGGLGAGDLGCVMSLSSGGKTAFLCWLAAQAASTGKRVLYVTLEDPRSNIDDRLRKIMSGKEVISAKGWGALIAKTRKAGGKLNILEIPPVHVTVRELEHQLPEDLDMLVVDYADYLLPPSGEAGLDYQSLGAVALNLRGIGQIRGIPVWTASQANRPAYETGRINMHNAEGSMKKMHIARQVVSINFPENVTKKGRKKGEVTLTPKEEKHVDEETARYARGEFWVAKNTYGRKLVAVPFEVDWALNRFKEL